MAFGKRAYRLTGTSPLLMHSSLCVDSLHPITIEKKKVAKKKPRTENDEMRLRELEFLGSLYVDEKDRPVMPGQNIMAMIREAAKKQRQGKNANAGVFVYDSVPIQYDGPKTGKALVKDERFRDVRVVRNQASRIMRTRPKFDEWAIEFEVTHDDELVDGATLDGWMDEAGERIGLGDFRPMFGRFKVERLKT